MHLGEYAWIIAFGDEILRCKISHHISLAPLDSFSSRRSLGPYHAFDLLDKSEFDRILDDKKQSCDEVLPGEVPGRTVLIRGEGIRNCKSFERINFSASPGRFFGYFLVDTRK